MRYRSFSILGMAAAALVVAACSPPADSGDKTAAATANAATDSDRRDILGTEEKLYSQQNEELIIRDFFQDRRDGFFLDIGCALPRRISTTYYLEKHLGWHGIGVDAVAEYGEGWKIHRPNSIFLNFLITDHSDTADKFYRAGWWELSSSKKHMVEKEGMDFEEREVMTATIDRIVETHNVEKIDFMSMDIEGAQMEALAGFTIEEHKPELVGIEAYEPDRDKILAFFQNHGYERIDRYLEYDQVNWYFTPKRGS